jgi:flagellar hook-basal body complex protein FliE
MVDKIANPAAAAGAYANTAKVGINTGAKNDGMPSFGDVMKDTIASSINTMYKGETMAAKAVTGDATLPDVVQAVNAAELTLSTVVAVRDRLVNAYTEIMRMQV